MSRQNHFAELRKRMVERQVAARGVGNKHVLWAMRRVPREIFVSPQMREFAYEDSPLPIEVGQAISQPYLIALMIEAAGIKPGDRVLEVGDSSGYATALIANIATHVYTIKRHAEMAQLARGHFARLGYHNIDVRTDDGNQGWPEAAPFDAIIVMQSAPQVPGKLLHQLTLEGRLVMPIGESPRRQCLVRITRVDDEYFEREELPEVTFVPLASASEGVNTGNIIAIPAKARERGREISLSDLIRAAAEPLPALEDDAFGAMFDRYAKARMVLLGEASHGTSEFYRARAAITRRLIEAHGFNIVAAEADWPDAAAVDAYVRHRPERADAEPAFQRFPTWMWRNIEFEGFIEWLRKHNAERAEAEHTGFYGLDLYSLNRSIRAVIDYLDRVDPQAARVARERYGCLTPWAHEPSEYGRMVLSSGFALCEQPVLKMLRDVLQRKLDYAQQDGAAFFDAAQNARLIGNAEAYYRVMYYGSADSWNLRDTHMFETLRHLLAAKGPSAKAVVWAHNSHIGDARYTEMGQVRDELNLGQLCREHFGDQVALIGFGTHGGTVAAASNWDEPMQIMRINPSRAESYERLCHDADVPRCLFDLGDKHGELRQQLMKPRLERFIGVIYRPATERYSHYSEAQLPEQFNAYVWFDQTRAVAALPGQTRAGVPDTYPFGL